MLPFMILEVIQVGICSVCLHPLSIATIAFDTPIVCSVVDYLCI
jgi:hypothetical protein